MIINSGLLVFMLIVKKKLKESFMLSKRMVNMMVR
nr:MAG TPA: hypothetical protein [Caudoviricetes sp.]